MTPCSACRAQGPDPRGPSACHACREIMEGRRDYTAAQYRELPAHPDRAPSFAISDVSPTRALVEQARELARHVDAQQTMATSKTTHSVGSNKTTRMIQMLSVTSCESVARDVLGAMLVLEGCLGGRCYPNAGKSADGSWSVQTFHDAADVDPALVLPSGMRVVHVPAWLRAGLGIRP